MNIERSGRDQALGARRYTRWIVAALFFVIALGFSGGFFFWNAVAASITFWGEQPTADELRESAFYGFIGFGSLAVGFLALWLIFRKRGWLFVAVAMVALGLASSVGTLSQIEG